MDKVLAGSLETGESRKKETSDQRQKIKCMRPFNKLIFNCHRAKTGITD